MTATAEPVADQRRSVTAAVHEVEQLLAVGRSAKGLWGDLGQRLERLDDVLLEQYSRDIGATGSILAVVVAQPRLRGQVEELTASYGETFARLRQIGRRIGLEHLPSPQARAVFSDVRRLCRDVRRLMARIDDCDHRARGPID